MSEYAAEIARGERFTFGANWTRFLTVLDDARIEQAMNSLKEMLGVTDLKGKRFLDIGSGSGLFSLAARRLGAQVHSFDYDPQSVACARELKHRYFDGDANWTIAEGSALDSAYLSSLGEFDVVYSWGVLHHTGAMWQALENAALPVASGGKLFIAIYNDQGWISGYWTAVKRLYNRSAFFRYPLILLHAPYLFGVRFALRALTGRLQLERGMSLWYDMLDWLGGYPFEVATPRQITEFYHKRGFSPTQTKTCGKRHGCNQFVFERIGSPDSQKA